jgi:hypothetical protein
LIKLGTLWLTAVVGTVILCQPRTFIAFAGCGLAAGLFWAGVLHWLFPEPSGLGGMPDSFRKKAWDEHFGRNLGRESPESLACVDHDAKGEGRISVVPSASASGRSVKFDPEGAREGLRLKAARDKEK